MKYLMMTQGWGHKLKFHTAHIDSYTCLYNSKKKKLVSFQSQTLISSIFTSDYPLVFEAAQNKE